MENDSKERLLNDISNFERNIRLEDEKLVRIIKKKRNDHSSKGKKERVRIDPEKKETDTERHQVSEKNISSVRKCY